MIITESVKVKVSGPSYAYYKGLGYTVPPNQKCPKILVNVKDLSDSSRAIVQVQCSDCGKVRSRPYGRYIQAKNHRCQSCHHIFNPPAKSRLDKGKSLKAVSKRMLKNGICDITGEDTRLFLVVHHVVSRSNGGTDDESNLVVLSANIHTMYHRLHGNKNTKEQYLEFKRKYQN